MAGTQVCLELFEATFQFHFAGVRFFQVSPNFAFTVFKFRYSATEEIVDYFELTDPSLQVVIRHVETASVHRWLHV